MDVLTAQVFVSGNYVVVADSGNHPGGAHLAQRTAGDGQPAVVLNWAADQPGSRRTRPRTLMPTTGIAHA